jgi:DNA-binding MarR family transcriptional regulator
MLGAAMSDNRIDPLEMHRKFWPETFDFRLMSFLLSMHQVRVAQFVSTDGSMTRHSLSLAEFDVLATLRRCPPPRELTPTELQGALVITSGGLTKVLRQLESRGLIARSTAVADRRVKPVRLTAKGAKLIEQAMTDMLAASTAWIKPALANKEIDQLTALLRKISWAPRKHR